MMKAPMTAEAIGRLKFKPPSANRLVKKIADGGSERSRQDERRPEKKDPRTVGPENMLAASTANPPPNTQNAPCSYPVLSANQSPSAVPSVCEKVMATQ